jgi:GNAT superfamily N-acetyltransferase
VRRLASIFCRRGPAPGVARQRLFLVEPEARGLGLGQGLLGTCLDFAREAGYARMTLATHASHRAACALYAKSGFCLTRSEHVRSFGVDLVARGWTRDL